MFSSLTLRGAAGSVLWGYRAAVELSAWTIAKDAKTGGWVLKGTPARVDTFAARQRPLLFTAPKEGGMWMWAVESLQVGPSAIVAQLGPPQR